VPLVHRKGRRVRSRRPRISSLRVADLERRLEELEASRSFLRAVIDCIGDPIFVKDREHRLVLVNRAECELSGHTADALLGKTDYDFFPRAEVDVFWAKDDLVLATGQEDVNEEVITDARGAVRTIVTKKTLHRARRGDPFIVGVIRDITERKQAEDEVRRLARELEARVAERTAQLEHEKEQLAVTLRSIADAVITTDTAGRVQLMNSVAERLTGWSLGKARGHHLGEVLRLDDGPIGVGALLGRALALAPGAKCECEQRLVGDDGKARIIALDVAPIRDRGGARFGVVSVFRDVTEKLELEQRLANAERVEALGVLAAGIAHDFNNLLTGVFGHLELALKASPEGSDAGSHLSSALAVSESARALTRELLTFAKGGAPVKAPVHLGPLLARTIKFVLSGSAVVAEFDLADDLWCCEADEGQIGQVVHNVAINALQAMPDGGRLGVAARNRMVEQPRAGATGNGRFVEIVLQDTGVGIPATVLPRIFDPFFTTKAKGSGLGLPVARSVVGRHGGELRVESAPGSGTAVTIRLPACDPQIDVAEEPPPPAPSRAARILVVDDEPSVRVVLNEMLRRAGHSVETAASGSEGIARFAQALERGRGFDVVVLDLTIPGDLSGTGTLRRIAALCPDVVAVATSGYADDAVMAEPVRFGFANALPKPFTMAQAHGVVAEALARAKRPNGP
jgi:PAS domain S-box-containing protein